MIKNCERCEGNRVKKHGRSKSGKQRYFCKRCGKAFIWKNVKNRDKKTGKWFEWWIREGMSIRQISLISKYSESKIKRLKNKLLGQDIPELYTDYKNAKYLIFDGTYFKRTNSLLLFMNDAEGKIISCRYVESENYENVLKMAQELKSLGVEPESITLDGLKPVIAAVKEIWPNIIIQRCLYHIERQGLMWLRRRPKTGAGQDLRDIYKGITSIRDERGKIEFTNKHTTFLKKHKQYIDSLSYKEAGYKDLKKATTLIGNAYDDMWHYLKDKNIPRTTNKLEGYFSELKQQYVKHKGMSRQKRDSYFKWYCYYKNN